MSAKKELGQVFTPEHIVVTMLDRIGYQGAKIIERTLLEPSCGEGVFLLEAARRLIQVGKQSGLTPEDIAALLEENLHGIDCDQDVLDTAKGRLDELALAEGLPNVQWTLIKGDALTYNPDRYYDYVVGNPPYIRVHNMPQEMRQACLKFKTASLGTYDLYTVFFELGLDLLKEDGVLAYITPNSWLKNASQKRWREYLIQNHYLREIVDYGTQKVFEDASTYAAITILDKAKKTPAIDYTEMGVSEAWGTQKCYSTLEDYRGEPLVFTSKNDSRLLERIGSRSVAVSDRFSVQNGIATLRDKVFLSAPINTEEEMLRPVVKASTYKGEPLDTRILFPYAAEDNYRGMTEGELEQYPVAYAHLLAYKDILLERTSDKNALWFHYGRNQGLRNLSKPSLTFSHVVAPDQEYIKCYVLPAGTVVYSGLFVTAKDGYELEELKVALEDPEFCRYIRITGKDMNNGYKSFGTKQVSGYRYNA